MASLGGRARINQKTGITSTASCESLRKSKDKTRSVQREEEGAQDLGLGLSMEGPVSEGLLEESTGSQVEEAGQRAKPRSKEELRTVLAFALNSFGTLGSGTVETNPSAWRILRVDGDRGEVRRNA